MYNAECRLCQKISGNCIYLLHRLSNMVSESITDEKALLKHVLAPRRPSSSWQALKFNGKTDHVKVRHHKKLCVTDRYHCRLFVVDIQLIGIDIP